MSAASAATVAPRDGGPAPGHPPSIVLRGLRKRFGAREALAGVDLELSGAQMVGVVGPDGAGKTTLLRTIVGLLDVEADEARVLGFDLRRDVRELKRHVGYVPQAFSLYRELSIHENLAFTARLHGLDDATFAARSGQLLESAGLTPFAHRPAGQLSGGMKQKLAIANALLPGPDLLVLDEPTAGIDVAARREIFEVLAALESRVLIVISTSYLEEAALCDHLVYMLGGRVIAQGSPHALESGTGTDAWRAWTDHAADVRAAAEALPWVESTRDCGRFVRLEVVRDEAPAPNEVARTLLALGSASRAASGSPASSSPSAADRPGLVVLAERAPTDLESTLLALARRAGEP